MQSVTFFGPLARYFAHSRQFCSGATSVFEPEHALQPGPVHVLLGATRFFMSMIEHEQILVGIHVLLHCKNFRAAPTNGDHIDNYVYRHRWKAKGFTLAMPL